MSHYKLTALVFICCYSKNVIITKVRILHKHVWRYRVYSSMIGSIYEAGRNNFLFI